MTGPEMAQGNLVAGRYRLDRHLGEGGMGTVWSAVHVVTRRAVAMKFLRTELQQKNDVKQRFLREAQAASALRHPNVVEVLDVFDLEDRSPVMVMELLDGETLGQKLTRDERLSTEETAAIMAPVVAAVGSAHAAGIVHRDLKPENIFLAQTPEGLLVKVLDFGIAKLSAEHYADQGQSVLVTEAGSMLGTPCYMAPEQISNAGVDYRADIWSLGVMLYECLSGTRPIEGQNMAEVVARLLSEAITPLDRLAPELPHELTAMVQQMLSRDPKRRPQDLQDISRVLGRYTHVRVSNFGSPRSRSSSFERVSPAVERISDVGQRPSNAERISPRSMPRPPGLASGRSVPQGGTMQSAPAVGFDRADGSIGTPSVTQAPAPSPLGQKLLIGAAGFAAALGVFWLLGFGRTPDAAPAVSSAPPVEKPSTAQAPVPVPAAPVATPAPPEPTPAPTAALPAPSAARSTIAKTQGKPASVPVRKVPKGQAAAPTGKPASEDTLFSGRK